MSQAVFSMSIVTDRNWGADIFWGFVVAFLASTFLLAGSLEPVINIWDKYVSTNLKGFMPWRRSDMDDESSDDEQDEKEKKEEKDKKSPEIQQTPGEWPKPGPIRRRTTKTMNGSASPENPADSSDGK